MLPNREYDRDTVYSNTASGSEGGEVASRKRVEFPRWGYFGTLLKRRNVETTEVGVSPGLSAEQKIMATFWAFQKATHLSQRLIMWPGQFEEL